VGGAVEDGGEQLRVFTPDSAAFEPQKSYILILRRDKNASAQQYLIPLSQTIVVTNDKVYPISGKFAWLTGMEAFSAWLHIYRYPRSVRRRAQAEIMLRHAVNSARSGRCARNPLLCCGGRQLQKA
jgi:hypothetical protein